MYINLIHQYLTDTVPESTYVKNLKVKDGQENDLSFLFKEGQEEKTKEFIQKVKDAFISSATDTCDKLRKIEENSKVYKREDIERICNYITGIDTHLKMPKFKKFSKDEVKKRNELSTKARDALYNGMSTFGGLSFVCDNLFHFGHQLPRQAQAVLSPKKPEDLEESLKIAKMIINPTKDNEKDRKDYITKQILNSINLTKELKYTYTDEEFVNKFADRVPEIFTLVELQKGTIDIIEKEFKITLDESVKKLWLENESEFVAAGSQINKFSQIGNPCYKDVDVNTLIEFKDILNGTSVDPDDLKELFNYHNNPHDYKLMKQAFDAIESDKTKGSNEEKTFNEEMSQNVFDTLGDSNASSSFCSVNEKLIIDDDHPKNYYATYNQENVKVYILGELSKNFDITEIKDAIENSDKPYAIFKDLSGNVLSVFDALDRVAIGKNVMLCDNTGNELRYFDRNSVELNWGTIENPDKYPKFNLESDSVDTIKARFSDLLKDLNEGTHWYMRSSSEYRNLRTSVSELLKAEYDSPSDMLDKINEIKNNAKAYIISKEDPNAEITSRTEPRIDACNKLINVITNSIQEPRVIENIKNYDTNVYLKSNGIKDNIQDANQIMDEKEMDEIENEEVKDVYNDIMKEEVKDDPIEKIDPTIDNNALSFLEEDIKGLDEDINFDDIENTLKEEKKIDDNQVGLNK